jgi:hypothetical protein
MFILEVITWWYGRGWRELLHRLEALYGSVGRSLSVSLLLRTLFAPWRQIISYGQESFIDGLRASLDNAVSRMVGFSVRMIILLVAGVAVVLITIISLVALILWPVLPVLGIVLLIKGLLP